MSTPHRPIPRVRFLSTFRDSTEVYMQVILCEENGGRENRPVFILDKIDFAFAFPLSSCRLQDAMAQLVVDDDSSSFAEFLDKTHRLTSEPSIDQMLSRVAGDIAKSTVATMICDPTLNKVLSDHDHALRCFFDDETQLERHIKTLRFGPIPVPEVDICAFADIPAWHEHSLVATMQISHNYLFVDNYH